ERGDPFEVRRLGDQPVIDRDAEREQHIDAGEIDRDVGRGRGLVNLDSRELRRQLARIDVRELLQDEDARHGSPSSRTALLTQMSARTWSLSGTVSMKWPASSACSNG